MSRAARAVQARRVELAPVKPVTGTWITPVTRDPLEVPIEDKIALLLADQRGGAEGEERPVRQLRSARCCAR